MRRTSRWCFRLARSKTFGHSVTHSLTNSASPFSMIATCRASKSASRERPPYTVRAGGAISHAFVETPIYRDPFTGGLIGTKDF